VRRAFLNPYFQIFLSALLTTASELLLKCGAVEAGTPGAALGFHALSSGWTWVGIISYLISFPCWLYVLRVLPLNIAFAMSSVVHVFIPVASWWFLSEHIGPVRMAGIALILAGIAIIAQPLAVVEEKL
jgi:multidrug transporter EmrE-like cation transporter